MKESAALVVLVALIVLGWNRSYHEQCLAWERAFLATPAPVVPEVPPSTPIPTPAPEPIAPIPPVMIPVATPRDNSWMWQRGVLDNPRQTGVDRAGNHTP
jgi:hypothetical protein